jgi:ubiquinone/menaquinone biosynthesis C-methylase UbiE
MPISDRLVSSRLVRKLATKYSDEWVFSPLLVTLSTKFVYPLATRLMGDDVVFMDWAYEEDPAMALPLAESDEPNRAHINLYHRTATQADLSGKRVLEISCGRGGGASYLVRTLHPASYTGLDLNPNGIAFCQKRHNHLPGLDFLQGNAEDLPFDDQSFDVVLNVEASHLYPRVPRFLAEVVRVLRAGGDFLYTDVRPRAGFADWEAALAEAPMRMMSQRVINEEVMRGIEASGQEMLAILGPVTRRAPSFIDGLARRASDLRASTFYQALQSGETSYRIYSFKKE